MKPLGWFSAVLAALFAVSVGHAQVGAPVAGASGPPSGTYTQAQQIAAAQALRTPYVLYKGAIAFISAPTGTMANNGAATLGTALGATYANAYMLLPAGAVAAGVPAASTWYFVQCSSTTVCTVFNNTYTAGAPTIPTSPTAFATTGPGAFTGSTSEDAGPTITVPAGAMGPNGALRIKTKWTYNNSAGTKTMRVRYGGIGGAGCLNSPGTTTTGLSAETIIANIGIATAQSCFTMAAISSGTVQAAGIVGVGAIDSTASQTLVHSLLKAVATDYLVLEIASDELLSDGT